MWLSSVWEDPSRRLPACTRTAWPLSTQLCNIPNAFTISLFSLIRCFFYQERSVWPAEKNITVGAILGCCGSIKPSLAKRTMPLCCKLCRLVPPKTSLSKGKCSAKSVKGLTTTRGEGRVCVHIKKESVVLFSVKHLQEYISFCISRLFGVTGNCAACSKLIPAFEMVMRAKDNVYHLDCFACQLCNQR